MDINKLKIVYFLGIGGIGMSALARYCQSLGIEIHGYDLTPSKLTSKLMEEGMKIHFREDVSQIPQNTDLVVITPAIPSTNKELIYLQEQNYPMLKRAHLLGLLSQTAFTLAVAGTHGKTSISSMVAHILFNAGRNVTAIIGGVMNNYKSNAIIGKKTDYLVVEADEFDRSFLHLHPNISVISSMDDDHLDIYTRSGDLQKTFVEFALKTPEDGLLIYQENLNELIELAIEKENYGFAGNSAVRAKKVKIVDGSFVFDLLWKETVIREITMPLPGRHYIENALAASAMALQLGLSGEEIKSGLESFKGVERRFEFKIKKPDLVFIDDYAHHPKEIESTLSAVRELFPERKITVVFQPHLFTRTRDFAEGFAQSLEIADEIILLDIYPARELPIRGVTSKIILDKIEGRGKAILSKEKMLEQIQQQKPEVLVALGAGNIGVMVGEMQKILEAK